MNRERGNQADIPCIPVNDQLAEVGTMSQIDIQDHARNPIALMVCRSCGEHDEKVGIGFLIFSSSDHGAKEHQAIQAKLRGQPFTRLSKRVAERRR